MDEELFSIQLYTPGSDISVGFRPSQIIGGRTGNDVLLGYQPLESIPGQTQIDIFITDLTIEDPAFRQWNDRIILGDWQQAYYDNGNPQNFGLNDFALVVDFNPVQDVIQLHGNSADYQLLDLGFGTAIIQQKPTGLDVVSFLIGNSNLELGGKYFQFEGTTPPPGPVLPQTQQLGTSGFEITSTATTDALGNVYIAGGTDGYLGSSEGANAGLRDALVTKYDSQGNQLFSKQFGTSSFDTVYGIDTDSLGNFYVVGITEGDLAAPKQAQTSDVVLAKFDSDGNQLWIEQFGQDLISQAFSIDVDGTGDIYISGINVKPSEDLATDDFFVAKYDTTGTRQWFTEIGSVDNAFDESYGVTVGEDGSVYATGWTLGNLAGENAGLYDDWIAKYDNITGEQQWIRQFGTSDYEWSWGVDTDSQGGVYATGWTLGDLGGTGNAGSYDAWLAKYDSQGNQQWIRQFGTAGDDQSFRINIDSKDNIFLTGYTNDSLGGTNAGSYDAWVARYDTDGNQTWIQQFGTPDLEQAYSITSDNSSNLYVTGVTEGSLGDINAGSFDAWVAKLDAMSGTLLDFQGNDDPGVTLTGGDDADNLTGGNGNDILTGNKGRDTLTGTGGDDTVVGGLGGDILTGGGGKDRFVYETYRDRGDKITDFDASSDVIDLSQIFPSSAYSSSTPFSDYVRFKQTGSSTAVQVDPNGDPASDIFRTLVTLEGVLPSDLSASNFILPMGSSAPVQLVSNDELAAAISGTIGSPGNVFAPDLSGGYVLG